jgi:hypothetical protein
MPILRQHGSADGRADVLQLVRPDVSAERAERAERLQQQVIELIDAREAALETLVEEAWRERDAWQLLAKTALHQIAELQRQVERLRRRQPPATTPPPP